MKRHSPKPKYPLKRFTESAALRATNARYRKIDLLLREIQLLWGDVDNGIVVDADDLIERVETARLEAVASVQARVEERDAA